MTPLAAGRRRTRRGGWCSSPATSSTRSAARTSPGGSYRYRRVRRAVALVVGASWVGVRAGIAVATGITAGAVDRARRVGAGLSPSVAGSWPGFGAPSTVGASAGIQRKQGTVVQSAAVLAVVAVGRWDWIWGRGRGRGRDHARAATGSQAGVAVGIWSGLCPAAVLPGVQKWKTSPRPVRAPDRASRDRRLHLSRASVGARGRDAGRVGAWVVADGSRSGSPGSGRHGSRSFRQRRGRPMR